MHAVLDRVEKFGVIPVVKIENVKDAVPLAKALCEGGLPCAEVTFRTGGGRRVDSGNEGSISGNAFDRRNRSYNRTGR